jgi:hypothetical protein
MVDSRKFLRSGLGDDATVLQKDDARGEQERLAKVVGDKNNGFAKTAREGAEFTLKLGAGDGVEGAKGLVHQENGRVGGKGARDANALALPAGELVRAAIAVFCRFETDQGKEFGDTGRGASGIPFFERGNERDVLGDREMGEKPCVLNYIADAAPQTNGVPFGGSAVTDKDLAGGWHEEAIDQFQHRRFAAAAAAQEDKSLPGSDGEANVINNRARGTTVKAVRHILELNGGASIFCGRFRIHFD